MNRLMEEDKGALEASHFDAAVTKASALLTQFFKDVLQIEDDAASLFAFPPVAEQGDLKANSAGAVVKNEHNLIARGARSYFEAPGKPARHPKDSPILKALMNELSEEDSGDLVTVRLDSLSISGDRPKIIQALIDKFSIKSNTGSLSKNQLSRRLTEEIMNSGDFSRVFGSVPEASPKYEHHTQDPENGYIPNPLRSTLSLFEHDGGLIAVTIAPYQEWIELDHDSSPPSAKEKELHNTVNLLRHMMFTALPEGTASSRNKLHRALIKLSLEYASRCEDFNYYSSHLNYLLEKNTQALSGSAILRVAADNVSAREMSFYQVMKIASESYDNPGKEPYLDLQALSSEGITAVFWKVGPDYFAQDDTENTSDNIEVSLQFASDSMLYHHDLSTLYRAGFPSALTTLALYIEDEVRRGVITGGQQIAPKRDLTAYLRGP